MVRVNMPNRNTMPAVASDPFLSDAAFDQLYPANVQALSRRHWTPLQVARTAAHFLSADGGGRILDIGSGTGKFCLAAAHFQPGTLFFGVEQRSHLVKEANQVKQLLGLGNVHFIQGNFTQLDFTHFDHFYFYNAFYENLPGTEKIDHHLTYTEELFAYYNHYLYRLLDRKPAGTRLVTFHSLEEEVPPGYHVVGSQQRDLLKCWVKV